MPLYHFVTDDLPSNTIAPDLDDSNAVSSLAKDTTWSGTDRTAGAAVDEKAMGLCLAYLIAVGFMPSPPPAATAAAAASSAENGFRNGKGGSLLPTTVLTESQRSALSKIGGRGRVK
jgi:L-aminoadipate-semialdehyde dehydrogenase